MNPMEFSLRTMPSSAREDDLVFHRYEMRGSRMCAILVSRISGQEIAFDQSSLEERVRNLQAAGDPHEQTSAALAGFPEN